MSSSQIANSYITEQQQQLLKQLRKFQVDIQFQSLNELPGALFSDSPNKQKRDSQNSVIQSRITKRNSSFSSNLLKNSTQFKAVQPQAPVVPNLNLQKLFEQYQKKQQSKQYLQIKNRLLQYKQKSQQIYKVGEYIKVYEQQFNSLIQQKDSLVKMLQNIKGQTSDLVQKQKKYIDLTMSIKESLDYYTFHQKNQFNYPCEISCRQMFQDNLQSRLSAIMDGTEFFQENINYVGAKKQLNQFLLSKSKITSFIKSFLIKLLNKQNNFTTKFCSLNRINQQFDVFYPKSRIRCVLNFLLTFPHFKKHLKTISLNAKDQKKQQQVSYVQTRQQQIQQFLFHDSNLSLIRYLQQHNWQIYNEVMLNLFSFNRFNFHQNLISSLKKSSNEQNMKEENQKLDVLKTRIIVVIQIVFSEFMYFLYCASPSENQSLEFIKAWIYKLAIKYTQIINKFIREIINNKNAFQISETINNTIKQIPKYFKNISSGSYQSYILGCLAPKIINYQSHLIYLTQIFSTIKSKLLLDLQASCFNSLPKLTLSNNKQSLQQSINLLLSYLPLLTYCKSHAHTYMITNLDIIIKSIKQINQSIQSRFQCYSWNLIIFGSIKNKLAKIDIDINMISKQIRLDFNQSLNVIDRVKNVERSDSLIKYAQDIFNVIKTGMPTLNQLTMDFNKYVNQHYKMLESRFLKDILFIYGKNMIDFLQKVMEINSNCLVSDKQIKSESNKTISLLPNKQKQKQQIMKILQPSTMKSLYNSQILHIERFIKQSLEIIQIMGESKIKQKQVQIEKVKKLIVQVYEKLLDFFDQFYLILGENQVDVLSEFEEISKIREKQQFLWNQRIISEGKKESQKKQVDIKVNVLNKSV